MPETDAYMTYEGSATYPGCWESVTWIVMNKPVYLSRSELYSLRQLMQGEKLHPKAPLAHNNRPIQPLNGRTIRTNIEFARAGSGKNGRSGSDGGKNGYSANNVYGTYGKSGGGGSSASGSGKKKGKKDGKCPEVAKDMFYRANDWLKD